MSDAYGTKHAKSNAGPEATLSGGTWFPFNVTNSGNGNSQQDGQMCFTYTITADPYTGIRTLATGASLQYARDNNPTPPNNPRTLFTTTAPITANNDAHGTFTIPSVTYTTDQKVHIPHVGTTGGDYNTLGNMVFDPVALTITGQFVEIDIATDPNPCDWEAEVGN